MKSEDLEVDFEGNDLKRFYIPDEIPVFTRQFGWNTVNPTVYDGAIVQILAYKSDIGITSLNGLSVASQTFATGTTGTDFGISSTGSIHTFNLPSASATNRGLLTSTDWSSFNGKQNALGFTPINKAGDTGIGSLQISNTTASTNTTTGALVVAGGVGIAGKLNGNNAQFSGSITADLGGFIYVGGTSSQFLKADGSLDSSGILLTPTKVIEYNNKDASTGIKSGGIFSIGSPTSTFNLTPVIGVIRNRTNGLITEVSTINFVNVAVTNIAIQGLTYIKINTSGAIIQQPTPFTFSDYEDFIPICVIIHPDLTSISEFSYSANSINYTNVKVRNLGIAIGLINNKDNIITPNGANAKINISSGSIYSVGSNWDGLTTDGDIRTMSAQVAPILSRITRTGASTLNTDIDSSNYDLGGVLTAIGGGPNQWVNHLITLFTSGIISVQYGQQLYNSYNEAIAGAGNDPFVAAPNIEFGLSRYWLTIQKGTTNLTSALAGGTARLKDLGKFGLLTSSGSGSGLSVGGTDKQIQYNNSGSLGGAFNWDNSTQSAQFGSSVVKGTIHVVTNADGKDIFITRYSSDSSASLFIGEKARGTESSPTALQSGDTFGGIGGRVYGTTGFSSTNKANVTFITSEIQTDTAQGNYISFNATTAGTTTRTEVGRLDNTGFTLNGSKLILGGALTTVGAFATTITATGVTSVTLPISGTLYGTATGSITSAQLLNSLSDETGTGVAVFATSPTFTTSIIGGATFTLLNTTTTLTAFASATTSNLFGTTSAQSLNIAIGVNASGVTKNISIGINGASGSTTNVNIGSPVSGANGTINLYSPTIACSTTTNSFFSSSTTPALFVNSTNVSICGGATASSVTLSLMYNPTGSGNTKGINIGTSGLSGSITNFNFGSSLAGALGTAIFYSVTNSFVNGLTSAGNVALTGSAKIATYAGITTAGMGVAPILTPFQVTGRTTAYTAQSIISITTTGLYEFKITVEYTGGGSLWVTGFKLTYTNAGTVTDHIIEPNYFATQVSKTYIAMIRCDASTSVTFTTTLAGATTHNIDILPSRLV